MAVSVTVSVSDDQIFRVQYRYNLMRNSIDNEEVKRYQLCMRKILNTKIPQINTSKN